MVESTLFARVFLGPFLQGGTVCERFANLGGGGGGFPPGFSGASPEPFGAHIFHDMPCHVSHLVSVCGTGGHL